MKQTFILTLTEESADFCGYKIGSIVNKVKVLREIRTYFSLGESKAVEFKCEKCSDYNLVVLNNKIKFVELECCLVN